jgi:imidazole glycerol-phosphate synthase subunit HisH
MRAVGIIDIGIGNLGSIAGAVTSLGFDVVPIRRPSDLAQAELAILPGVGAFSHAMDKIDRAQLRQPLRQWVEAGKPLLGICLGMQLLFDSGNEGGDAQGLGLIPGVIRRLPEEDGPRLPHVGWNEIALHSAHPVMKDVKQGVDFYFVHSYAADCDPSSIVASTDYGIRFPSIVARGSVVGTQFHCEKSQRNGLQLLEAFCWWNGQC